MDDAVNTHLKGKKLSRSDYIKAMAYEYEKLAIKFAEQGDFQAVAEAQFNEENERTGAVFGSDDYYWTEASAQEQAMLHFLDFTKTKQTHSQSDLLFAWMMMNY